MRSVWEISVAACLALELAGATGLQAQDHAAGMGAGLQRPAEPVNAADLPVCRSEWSSQVSSMVGHRRCPAVSAWLGNGIRVHHMQMETPRARGEPVPVDGGRGGRGPAQAGGGQPASDGPRPTQPEGSRASSWGGLVMVTINVVGGELRETAANRGVTIGACAPWEELSVRDMPPARAATALEGRNVRFDAVPGQDTVQLRFSVRREDLEESMRVATALLMQPKVTEEGLRAVCQEAARQDDLRKGQEQEMVADTIAELIFPVGDARLRPPTREQLASLTIEQTQQWMDEQLQAGGAPIEMAIVGDITLEDAMRIASGYLGQLPRRERVSADLTRQLRSLPPPKYPIAATVQRPIEPGQAIVVVGFPGADARNPPDLRTTRVASRLVDEHASAALAEAGFDQPEVSAAALPASVYPGYGVVVANFRCDRDRADEAADVMLGALAKLARDGAAAEELPAITGELARAVEYFERQPWYWSGILARSDTIGVDIDDLAGGAAFYRSLNVETVNAAIKRNYGEGRTIRVIIESNQEK